MADGLTIPVVVKVDDNTPAPPDAVCYYIIAKNGIFLAKRVGVVEAVVKVARRHLPHRSPGPNCRSPSSRSLCSLRS